MKKRMLSAALALAVLTLTACGNETISPSASDEASSQTGTSAPAGVAVQVREVTLENVSTENRVSGKVIAENQHAIMVAATAKCTDVYVEAGDTVQAGDRICTLDLASTLSSYNAASINYDSLLQQFNAQKTILDKQIQMAEDNLNNLKALYEIGAASRLEIDNAELTLIQAKSGRDSALAQIEAGLQSGKSSLEQLKQVLENVDKSGHVLAPVSGLVTSLSAVKDGYVSASSPVAIIEGAGQMEVKVSVSETLVPKLTVGGEADISVSAIGRTFTGTIRSVEKSANFQTQLYTVTLGIPSEVTGLLAGMSADVNFRTDTAESAVVVPTEAILSSAGEQFVYIADNGLARRVVVTTGLAGSGVTQITSGLAGGEQLVVVGQTYLSDGDAVRIVSGEG